MVSGATWPDFCTSAIIRLSFLLRPPSSSVSPAMRSKLVMIGYSALWIWNGEHCRRMRKWPSVATPARQGPCTFSTSRSLLPPASRNHLDARLPHAVCHRPSNSESSLSRPNPLPSGSAWCVASKRLSSRRLAQHTPDWALRRAGLFKIAHAKEFKLERALDQPACATGDNYPHRVKQGVCQPCGPAPGFLPSDNRFFPWAEPSPRRSPNDNKTCRDTPVRTCNLTSGSEARFGTVRLSFQARARTAPFPRHLSRAAG